MKDHLALIFFIASWLISNSHLVAEDTGPDLSLDQNFLFISLGSNCEVAAHLNANHLRKKAYPFDWLLTCNHDRFLLLLDNDFAFFLDEQYLIQHPTCPVIIENCYYEIEFRHHWPFPDSWTSPDRYKLQIQDMQEKYTRRINRFRQLAHFPGKVFFIRAAYDLQNDPNLYWGIEGIEQITSEQAIELKDALEHYFPSLNFTLVILNYLENNVPSINGINNVIEFKISNNRHSDYTNAFNTLLSND